MTRSVSSYLRDISEGKEGPSPGLLPSGADAFFTQDQAGETLVAMADSAQRDVRDAARRVALRLEQPDVHVGEGPGVLDGADHEVF